MRTDHPLLPDRLTNGQHHAIREHLPDGSHLAEAGVTQRRHVEVKAGRCLLPLLAGEAPSSLGQQRRERRLQGQRIPPPLRRLDAARGEGGVRPLLIEDLLAQARKGRQRWIEGHVVAVEEEAAGPQQAPEVPVETGQRFRREPM